MEHLVVPGNGPRLEKPKDLPEDDEIRRDLLEMHADQEWLSEWNHLDSFVSSGETFTQDTLGD
eukprot:11973143-Prorocentrum_lima.AAC.1